MSKLAGGFSKVCLMSVGSEVTIFGGLHCLADTAGRWREFRGWRIVRDSGLF
jgi:hypothetical protein